MSMEAICKGMTHEAYERIAAMILSGELRGGANINDRRLSETLGYSRTPIREALRRLEGEEFLTRSGRSTVVSTVDLQSVLQILSARILIEGETAKLAAASIQVSQLDAIRTAIKGLLSEEMVASDRHWDADNFFHISIAEAAGNTYLTRMISDMRKRTRIFGIKRIPERFDYGINEHLAIVNALEDRDATAASQLMVDHISRARQSIIDKFVG